MMNIDLSDVFEVLSLAVSVLSFIILLILLFSRKGKGTGDELRRLEEDLKGLRSDVSASLYKVMEQNKSTSETLFHEQRRESKEMGENFSTLRENIRRDMDEIRKENINSIEGMTKRTKELEVEVSSKLEMIMEMNMQKLDQMRTLVGENLHETLGKSLSESFSVVSKNHESLHDAIGEMWHRGSEARAWPPLTCPSPLSPRSRSSVRGGRQNSGCTGCPRRHHQNGTTYGRTRRPRLLRPLSRTRPRRAFARRPRCSAQSPTPAAHGSDMRRHAEASAPPSGPSSQRTGSEARTPAPPRYSQSAWRGRPRGCRQPTAPPPRRCSSKRRWSCRGPQTGG